MTQADPTIQNAPGAQVRGRINNFNAALMSSHAGTAPPAGINEGGMYLNAATSPWKLRMLTNLANSEYTDIFHVNPATRKISFYEVDAFTCAGTFTSKGIVDTADKNLVQLLTAQQTGTVDQVFLASNAQLRLLSGRAADGGTDIANTVDALLRLDNFTENGAKAGMLGTHRVGTNYKTAGYALTNGGVEIITQGLSEGAASVKWIFDEAKRLLPKEHRQNNIGASGLEIAEVFANVINATTVNQSSDERKKKPLGMHKFDLGLFMDIEVKDFAWKDDAAENGQQAQRIVGMFWQQLAATFEKHGYDVETEGLLRRTPDDAAPDDRSKDRLSLDLMCLIGRMIAGMQVLFREVQLISRHH